MDIVRPGKKRKSIDFICTKCGCEFICNEGEYFDVPDLTSVSVPPTKTSVANCPCCCKICKSYLRIEAKRDD